MNDAVILYVTVADIDTAQNIGRTIIQERLAACANIIGGAISVYEWQGNVEESPEAILIVKTTAQQAVAARDRIVALHPYDLPCVVGLQIDENRSHKPFLDWIAKATKA